jgi:hypothetical protein
MEMALWHLAMKHAFSADYLSMLFLALRARLP